MNVNFVVGNYWVAYSNSGLFVTGHNTDDDCSWDGMSALLQGPQLRLS